MRDGILECKQKGSKGKSFFNLDNLASPDAADVIKSIVNSKKEYEETREKEQTKRFDIEKTAEGRLETLRAKKEMVQKISSEVFKERRETLDKGFNILEKALEEDKDSVAIAALDGITKVVTTSPLKDIDSISKALENDDMDLIL